MSSPVDVCHDFLCLSFSVIATLYNVTYSHMMYCTVCFSDVNIEFFQNPDIESENPVKVRISDFI